MFQLTRLTKRIQPGPNATFADLPVELAIRVVAFAIETDLKDAKRAYLSLVHVSSRTQAIAHTVCLSQFPIMLRTRSSLDSFHALLENHPNAGSSVRNLWLIPDISSSEQRQIGGAILLACQQLERLACNVNLLNVFTQSPPPFRHDRLRDLTITSNLKKGREHPFGPTLFGQLTHFRFTGLQDFVIPPFLFTSLTHASFSCHGIGPAARTFDSTQFPSLEHIVPTIPYKSWRYKNLHNLRTGARQEDERVELIPCPKEWEESEIWEMAGRWGEASIWERAASGSDIHQHRDDIPFRGGGMAPRAQLGTIFMPLDEDWEEDSEDLFDEHE